MKRLVIYDSQYGNTEKVAQEIAKSLSAKAVPFSDVKSSDMNGLDLLVVGSPTQGGRATPALNQFLIDLPSKSLINVKVAVFDTRFQEKDLNFALKLLVRTIDYAAPKMAKILLSKGGNLIVPPEGFIVKGKRGPLKLGEIERASTWLENI
jgi:flavodoxin